MANGDDAFQIDPAQLIPVTGRLSGSAPAALPVKFEDLSAFLPQGTKQAQQAQQSPPGLPDIIKAPAEQGFSKGRGGNKIQGIVIHSSDGTESSDVNTLRGGDPNHRVSSHYYVTRDGRIYQFVPDQDTAWHAGETLDNQRYGNSATIGIEQEHIDGKQDWPDAQVNAAARLTAHLKGAYQLGDDQIYGHSQIAPERKQDPVDYPWQKFSQFIAQASQPSPRVASSQPMSSEGSSPTWQDLSQYLIRQ
jgi:N-acetyl-anhydromuramyl-L-alanine amidase AmpD